MRVLKVNILKIYDKMNQLTILEKSASRFPSLANILAPSEKILGSVLLSIYKEIE